MRLCKACGFRASLVGLTRRLYGSRHLSADLAAGRWVLAGWLAGCLPGWLAGLAGSLQLIYKLSVDRGASEVRAYCHR